VPRPLLYLTSRTRATGIDVLSGHSLSPEYSAAVGDASQDGDDEAFMRRMEQADRDLHAFETQQRTLEEVQILAEADDLWLNSVEPVNVEEEPKDWL
jgi:hypothetical protein